MRNQKVVVTGGLGYSGKYIAQILINKGVETITLTNSPNRPNPFAEKITIYPFNFDNPKSLTERLRGVSTLINTYWVRFNHKSFTHAQAVKNTEMLFACAKNAGIRRIVHSSISNADINSPLEYFRCKAHLEKVLIDSGVDYTILRPTVLFGHEDILINNIAWGLRYAPFFVVFGDGNYKLQPIHVEDFANLAVDAAFSNGNNIINANGCETYTYRELAKNIAKIINVRRLIIPLPHLLAYIGSVIVGKIVGDVLLTYDEVKGLMANALAVDTPATGTTKLSEWVIANAEHLGKKYANELLRRK